MISHLNRFLSKTHTARCRFNIDAFSTRVVVVCSGKTLRDLLEALPREWISEDLMDALATKDIQLSPTMYALALELLSVSHVDSPDA